MKVLITGAKGFVGKSLTKRFVSSDLKCIVKSINSDTTQKNEIELTYSSNTDWSGILNGVTTVVHLGAIAHVKGYDYKKVHDVNVGASIQLAKKSILKGVKRFIFLSSLSVNDIDNDSLVNRKSLTFMKFETENLLKKLFLGSQTELVIIRSPLCYGPGVKANFLSLIKLVSLRFPLPFSNATKRGSYVYVENLSSFIYACISFNGVLDGVFYVSDGNDICTNRLIKLISLNLSISNKLFAISPNLMLFALKVCGKENVYNSLFNPNTADVASSFKILTWAPPHSVDEGVEKTVKDFLITQ